MVHRGSVLLTILFVFTIPYTNCSNARFEDVVSKGSAGATAEDVNNVLDIIDEGGEVDPGDLDDCGVVDPDFPTACLVFKDTFERDEIVNHESFQWDTVLMDKRSNLSNVDVKIEDTNHLGPVEDGERALLFRGRAGGSTHEVYLVSAPFDISSYDTLVIQFKYVPIDLEDEITLSWNGLKLPEGPSISYCESSDYDCGLEGNDRYRRLREPMHWERYSPAFSSGGDNQIRDYSMQDWQLGQMVINVSDIPVERRDKFVFKISVAIDEGYFHNNRDKLMEDGVILDDVVFAAIRTNTIQVSDNN